MKTLNKLFLLTGFLAVIACQKETSDALHRPSQFNEIVASNTFDWQNYQHIDFLLDPVSTPKKVTHALIISTDAGDEIYKSNYQMDQGLSIKLSVPKKVKALTIKYGTIEKTVGIQGGTCATDLILLPSAYNSF